MKAAFLCSVIILASLSVVKADLSPIEYYLYANAIHQASQTCAPWGGDCTRYPCCQYWYRGQISCFSGQCLQAQCGYPGQVCGYTTNFITAECCYHLGLECVMNAGGWNGICTPSTPAV